MGSVLVGRDREMGEGLATLEDAFAGRGRLILLSGEAGIGKSRFADEIADRAVDRGATVVWGRCWEAGGAPAYWPWVQALRSLTQALGSVHELQGSWASDIAQLLPELREGPVDVRPPPTLDVDPESARFRLFDATARFLSNGSSERPLVMVLDDLHAADVPSLMMLRFVAGQIHRAHILVIGAYRDSELTREHPLTDTLAELSRESATRRIHLHGLSGPEVAQFIRATMEVEAPETLVTLIHDETEGNPLFVGEVVRLLAAEGRLGETVDPETWRFAIPVGVREVIARRINRLSKECGRTLGLASVLGREFDPLPLQHLAAITPDELLETLDEAVAAGVLGEVPGVPGRLRFSHALIRDTLYDELSPARRTRLHRRVGEVLMDLHGKDVQRHFPEIAHHLFLGARPGDAGEAAEYAKRAGDQAVGSLAYEEAARLYGMSLQAVELDGHRDELTRCELLLALGDALARAGDASGARERLLEAARIGMQHGFAEHVARAALGYGGRIIFSAVRGDPDFVPLLEESLRMLGDDDSHLRVKVMARLAGGPLRDDVDGSRRASLARDAVEMAKRLGDAATLAYALGGLICATWQPLNDDRMKLVDE